VSPGDIQQLVIGALQGLGASTVFVLALFIGFCVVVGFTKLKRTAGGNATVIKSLDEVLSRRPMEYLKPSAPRGPADQLKAPELLEAAARK
jgi:acid phosphatase family membrane protein YuiD